MKKRLNKKGFTLIELIVVIAILAILAAILIPSLTGYLAKANRAKDQANCRAAYTQYVLDVATANGVAVADPVVPGATMTASYTGEVVDAGFACAFANYTFTAPTFQ